jgi:hypothetical protein
MYSRDIKMCHPELQRIWPLHQDACADIGITIKISCTSRQWDEQRALHAQGREVLEIVNHLRNNCNMPEITEAENKKVTWTLDSPHVINNGKRDLSDAYDIFVERDGKAVWNDKAVYAIVAEVGRNLGLKCGIDFGDAPHFERMV